MLYGNTYRRSYWRRGTSPHTNRIHSHPYSIRHTFKLRHHRICKTSHRQQGHKINNEETSREAMQWGDTKSHLKHERLDNTHPDCVRKEEGECASSSADLCISREISHTIAVIRTSMGWSTTILGPISATHFCNPAPFWLVCPSHKPSTLAFTAPNSFDCSHAVDHHRPPRSSPDPAPPRHFPSILHVTDTILTWSVWNAGNWENRGYSLILPVISILDQSGSIVVIVHPISFYSIDRCHTQHMSGCKQSSQIMHNCLRWHLQPSQRTLSFVNNLLIPLMVICNMWYDPSSE